MDNTDRNPGTRLTRLLPPPAEAVALRGLYLNHDLRKSGTSSRPYVYSSFIASLDGRISLPHPTKPTHMVPGAIANPRDWRLFQELAAQADVLITSGRYMRQLARDMAQDSLPVSEEPDYADLIEWRKSHGLAPQPAVVILSASLNIPVPTALLSARRPIYVATGAQANPRRLEELKAEGVQVITAGSGSRVEGRRLIGILGQLGFATIDMIAGPDVLNTLMADRRLDRLYLTQALRMLGGVCFDTLLKGEQLNPAADFSLCSLHYDTATEGKVAQLFCVYESAL